MQIVGNDVMTNIEKLYMAFRGTARKMAADPKASPGQVCKFVCIALASETLDAFQAANNKLKVSGYVMATVDGAVLSLPPANIDHDTEQGAAMRQARQEGAVVVLGRRESSRSEEP